MQNIWLMLVLFTPIIAGNHHLYPWSRPEQLADNAHLQMVAHTYLRESLWLVRAGLYFAFFIAFVWLLMRISRRQDQPPEVFFDRKLRVISAQGAVIYLFVTLFPYTDWLMSLTPGMVLNDLWPDLQFRAGIGSYQLRCCDRRAARQI